MDIAIIIHSLVDLDGTKSRLVNEQTLYIAVIGQQTVTIHLGRQLVLVVATISVENPGRMKTKNKTILARHAMGETNPF